MDLIHHPYDGMHGLYTAPSFGKREALERRKNFTLSDLSPAEFEKMIAGFGAMAEDVLPLTEAQAWFFSNHTILSPDFHIQALFKVNGIIRPQEFSDHIDALIRRCDILRSAFLYGARPLRIVLKVRSAEIRFHDLANLSENDVNHTLERIMAADRRRGFDLQRDRLLRIGVFKTAPKEYAVLVAQPQIIADGWDFGLIFADMFINEETDNMTARKLKKRDFSFGQYLDKRNGLDRAPAMQYWKKLLAKIERVSRIPGCKIAQFPYQQAVRQISVGLELTEVLQQAAGNQVVGFIAFLQTAWGIMLQHYNRSNDAVYGAILSNRSAKMDNIEDVASIVNVIPIRITCPLNMAVGDLAKRQQAQLLLSQPYSYCTPDELQAISELEEPLFNHLLNFHSFGKNECFTDIKAPFGVTPVGVNSFDHSNTNLGIYFRTLPTGLGIEFVYDANCFSKGQIELLQQGYLAVLRQMVQRPDTPVYEIKMPSIEQIVAADLDPNARKAELMRFLHCISLFSSLTENVLEELAVHAKSEYYVEGDVIVSEGAKQDKFFIVYSGVVELSRNADSGWSQPLKILKTGSTLGYDSLFAKQPSFVRAEALNGEVVMISIPTEEMERLMRKHFDLAVHVISELNEQVNRFQKLWISAG